MKYSALQQSMHMQADRQVYYARNINSISIIYTCMVRHKTFVCAVLVTQYVKL